MFLAMAKKDRAFYWKLQNKYIFLFKSVWQDQNIPKTEKKGAQKTLLWQSTQQASKQNTMLDPDISKENLHSCSGYL